MKILIAAGIYPPDPGGPAIHAQAQYVGFRKLGHRTQVVALAHYRKWPRWVRHLFYAIALFFKALRSQVVYSHDAWGVGFIAWFGARLTFNKFLIRIGGDLAWEKATSSGRTPLSMNEWYEKGDYKSDLFYKLSKFVVKRADALIVTAPILKEIYVKYYGVSADKIEVVANPLLEKRESALPVGEKIIYASRLVSYKNLDFVLKVLAKVFPAHPGVSFVVMGEGPERDNLEALAKELGISGQVLFRGTVSQADVLEATHDALFAIAPALTEFNPNYVLQAISYGKPYLISRENGLPFAVPEEFLFDARNESELHEKISNLLSKEGYERALKRVAELDFHMTWEESLKENERVIKALF